MLGYVGRWEASHCAERVHCAGETFDELEISQSPMYRTLHRYSLTEL